MVQRPTLGRTCSSADGVSWTIGLSTSLARLGNAPGRDAALTLTARTIVPLWFPLPALLLHQFPRSAKLEKRPVASKHHQLAAKLLGPCSEH